MRVALIGADGMLAADIKATAPHWAVMVALQRHELDLTIPESVNSVLQVERPDCVINASAYTQVDRAETEYDTALAVNGTAVTGLGVACQVRGIRVVHYSTDYVFPGDGHAPYREDDPVAPVNAYGRSKLVGERGLRDSGAHALILRTQWLYGLRGRSFPRTMWERAIRGAPTRVVADQFGRPTSTADLAQATWSLLATPAHGTYHVANGGDAASWFDVASAVFDAAGARDALTGCTSAEYPTAAARPRYSVLDTARLASDHGIELPPWRDSLARFLRELTITTGTPAA